MTQDSKESTLSRWSRRKLESQQAPEQTLPQGEAEANPVVPSAEELEAPPLTDADMPDIDSLNEDSDFSGFMSAGVSDKLRNLALRKLFKSSVFNIRDGLDEYDEDYTTFEKLGDIVTSDMKHEIEMKEQKLREAMAAEAEAAEEEIEVLEDIEDEDAPEDQADIVAEVDPEPVPEPKNE